MFVAHCFILKQKYAERTLQWNHSRKFSRLSFYWQFEATLGNSCVCYAGVVPESPFRMIQNEQSIDFAKKNNYSDYFCTKKSYHTNNFAKIIQIQHV